MIARIMMSMAISLPFLKIIPHKGEPIYPEPGFNPAATDETKGQYQCRDFPNILLQ